VSLNDVLEIFVTAPSTPTITYLASQPIQVQATGPAEIPVYTAEQMGVRAGQSFTDAVEVENNSLTDPSVNNLESLAELNPDAQTVTLGPYTGETAVDSYDQIAYRAGNTFYSMGKSGWDNIVNKLIEAGITNQDDINAELWRINQNFLDKQIAKDKIFEFTVNPSDIDRTKFAYKEYLYLKEKGYQFHESNGVWTSGG
jgi:hypothetical protein